MRSGVRLAIDVGLARIGVARSDPDGLFASPVETVPRTWQPGADQPSADLDRLAELCADAKPIELLVGLPLALSGSDTASTADARAFAQALATRTGLPVRLIDERLSTVSAHAQLHASGKRTRSHRGVVDQVAAVILLQHALDAERSGSIPGALLGQVG